MTDEDNNFGCSLVLDFRKWWCHMQAKNCTDEASQVTNFGKWSTRKICVSNISHCITEFQNYNNNLLQPD